MEKFEKLKNKLERIRIGGIKIQSKEELEQTYSQGFYLEAIIESTDLLNQLEKEFVNYPDFYIEKEGFYNNTNSKQCSFLIKIKLRS